MNRRTVEQGTANSEIGWGAHPLSSFASLSSRLDILQFARGPRGVRRHRLLRMARGSLITLLLCRASLAPAAEIHSNGTGGGPWNQATTWHGGAVPGSNDTVVIAMRDSVLYDRAGTDEPACADLRIDPEGVLSFKKMPGRLVLAIRGTFRSYGILKMDATGADVGIQELRLAPPPGTPQEMVLLENSALLAYGRETAGTNARNILIAGPPAFQVVANDRSMIDLQYAAITGLVLRASYLDNTGNKPNERLNLIGCLISGTARVILTLCDTPAIKNNVFETAYKAPDHEALFINTCSLAQIIGNTFRGTYQRAIHAEADTDSTALGNTIEGCEVGMYWTGKQAMIKQNRLARCDVGIQVVNTTGVIESTLVADSRVSFHLNTLTLQLTDCRAEGLGTNRVPLQLDNASVTLLNCNIADDQIKFTGQPPAPDFAENMQYVVARVAGALPGELQVDMFTAAVSGGVPAGKADLNVRNSPARVSDEGWTPSPGTMRALTVRSWRLGRDGKVVRPPFYDLVVSLLEDGKPPRELKRQLVEPQDKWYRPEPNEKVATVEIAL